MDTSLKYVNKNEFICHSTAIPYLHYPQGNTPALFIHANGYPSACYEPMLKHLKGFDILAPLSRPCWDESDPYGVDQWAVLADDLVQFAQAHFNHHQQPFQCISHSMGAVVLLMAIERAPHLFGKLVFIDPIFLPLSLIHSTRLIPESLSKRLKMVKKTINRPSEWECLQAAFDFHRTKRAYKALPDEALWQYIVGGTKLVNEQWQLRYDKCWEAWFYHHLPNPWPLLRHLDKPALGIRAQHSEFLTSRCWEKWQKLQPYETFIEFKGHHHLLPMESPVTIAHTILDFLE